MLAPGLRATLVAMKSTKFHCPDPRNRVSEERSRMLRRVDSDKQGTRERLRPLLVDIGGRFAYIQRTPG